MLSPNTRPDGVETVVGDPERNAAIVGHGLGGLEREPRGRRKGEKRIGERVSELKYHAGVGEEREAHGMLKAKGKEKHWTLGIIDYILRPPFWLFPGNWQWFIFP